MVDKMGGKTFKDANGVRSLTNNMSILDHWFLCSF